MTTFSLGLAVTSACVTNQGTGGAAWSPASLFESSEVGAWYDPSDLGTLWQDTAATTPVTTVGQSVARIDDKSGNGFHLTQPTTSDRYGVLGQDANGKYYVQLAPSDILYSADSYGLTVPSHYCLGFSHTGTIDANPVVFGLRNSTAHFGLLLNTTYNGLFGTFDGTLGSDKAVLYTASITKGVPHVVDGYLDASTNIVAVNGGDDWSDASVRGESYTQASQRVVLNSTVGTGLSGGNLTMQFYGGVMVNRALSEAERGNLVDYMKIKTGLAPLDGYTYDLFGIAGQSNGSGQGDESTSTLVTFGEGIEYTDGRIRPLRDPTRHYATTSSGNISGTGSAWPAFADAYYGASSQRVCIVGGAVSGLGAANWNSGTTYTGFLATKLLAAKAHIESLGGVANIKGIVWVGGESDAIAGSSAETFKTNLEGILGKLRTALSDASLPMFMLSLDQSTTAAQDASYAALRTAMVEVAASVSGIELVMPYQEFEINSLLEDDVHWNQTALNSAGAISGAAVAGILYP